MVPSNVPTDTICDSSDSHINQPFVIGNPLRSYITAVNWPLVWPIGVSSVMSIESGDATTVVGDRYTVTVAESASSPRDATMKVHPDCPVARGVTTPFASTVAIVSSPVLQETTASAMR